VKATRNNWNRLRALTAVTFGGGIVASLALAVTALVTENGWIALAFPLTFFATMPAAFLLERATYRMGRRMDSELFLYILERPALLASQPQTRQDVKR
jgi:multisubunit Na+/H+ antiporter MnhG subunit